MSYRYAFHSTLTRAYLGEFLLKGVTFNSPLKGAGGQFNGVIVLDDKRQVAADVKAATTMEDCCVFVIYKDDDTGIETYLWGGIIYSRKWSRKARTVTIAASEFKSYFYTVEYSPSRTPPFANRKFVYAATDQLAIARALLADVTTRPGTPAVTYPIVNSTRPRDLIVFASDHKIIGDIVDGMADRNDGFDWAINIRKSTTDRLPELVADMYYPERGTSQDLTFSSTRESFDLGTDGRGTILDLPEWNEDSANRRTRVWATGAGSPPDQPIAMDDDPDIEIDAVVLRETTVNYGSVLVPATLSEHARAERSVLAVYTESIDIALKPNFIKPTDFSVGDRVVLSVHDEWLNIDEEEVRIVDKAIAPFSSQDGERILVTLDLSDATRADPDEGDTV